MSDESNSGDALGQPKKKRSVTSLTLGWLAERLRRTEQIKEKMASGQYSVESDQVAASILNEDS